MRFLSTTLRLGSAALTIVLVVLNLRLYSPGSETYGPDQLGEDVLPQLRFLGAALRNGAGERMQGLFPEGYFFTHALYGLAWVEAGLRLPPESTVRQQAIQEAGWALARLDSSAATTPFSTELDPPLGVFYGGWSNWLRGGLLMLQAEETRPSAQVERFQRECQALADAFNRSPTPFLPAYHRMAWPVDSVVAMATLRLHDALYAPRFGPTIDHWRTAAEARLDPMTGLLAHRVDALSGEPLEGSRGSSQSLIARFLIEVDPVWGRSQYVLFRRQFVRSFLGLPGVREYPAGRAGGGDVDSGPLVAGFSASATVVTLAAAQVHGDREVADVLIDVSEAAGLPIHWGGAKRYAFGLLPVGDAFLVWAKSSRPWVAAWSAASPPPIVASKWRLPLHAATLLISIGAWQLTRRMRT